MSEFSMNDYFCETGDDADNNGISDMNNDECMSCQCQQTECNQQSCEGEVVHSSSDETNHNQDHCSQHCADSCQDQCVERGNDVCKEHCEPHCDMHTQSIEDEKKSLDTDYAEVDEHESDAEKNAGDDAENTEESLTPLGKAKKEAMEYLEALQRERADFMNYRARMVKEQERYRNHGIIDVLTALLPAMDDIDRIRQHNNLDESFNAVSAKIDKAFEKFGVEKFGESGEIFDPTRHEAVLHKHDDSVREDKVDTVIEAGYRIGDRIIRAARVVVVSSQG